MPMSPVRPLVHQQNSDLPARFCSVEAATVSVFPGENYQAPRSWTERAYHKLNYYNQVDRGGRYAAWEQPQLFSEELRAGFKSRR
jgi:hypothetical protein